MEILYSDNSIVVCVTPAGVSSQDDGKPSCMVRQLMESQHTSSIFPVHRLDRDVSGVMVYGKTSAAAASLSRQIQNGTFKKEYIAVVKGIPSPLEGELRDLLFHDSSKNKSFVVKRPRKGVRDASLAYNTLDTTPWEAGSLSLIHVLLHTGRTHQIRVQFASRKMPILGDRKYGGGDMCPIALMSEIITFSHPETGEILFFHAPKPDFFPWNKFSSEYFHFH